MVLQPSIFDNPRQQWNKLSSTKRRNLVCIDMWVWVWVCVCELGPGVKLADFGSCRGVYSKQPYTEYISTRWYALLSWSQCVDISSRKVQKFAKMLWQSFVDQ